MNPATVTTERTAKRYKAWQLAGCPFLIAAVAVSFRNPAFGITLGVIGLAMTLGGLIAAWWHHG